MQGIILDLRIWPTIIIVPFEINNLLIYSFSSIDRYPFDGDFHSEFEGMDYHNFVVYPGTCCP